MFLNQFHHNFAHSGFLRIKNTIICKKIWFFFLIFEKWQEQNKLQEKDLEAKHHENNLQPRKGFQMHSDRLTIRANQSFDRSQKHYLKTKLRPPGGELLHRSHAESNSMQKNRQTEKISKCIFTRFCCKFTLVQPFLQKPWQWWTRSSFMHLRKLPLKLRNWQNATKNQVGFQNWCAYLIGQEHHQVRNILKTWLSCNITWDSNCCSVVAHWGFGESCNFWRFKSCHAIHNFKFKLDRCFKIRRLFWRIFRWRRRIIRWLLHHGKFILTRTNITAYTDKPTHVLTIQRLRIWLIGPFQGHPYSNVMIFINIQEIAGWFQIFFRKIFKN